MVFFPVQVMPKNLRKTASDVDGYPLVYNAGDHNAHQREIIAIQKFLIGSDGNGGLKAAFENVKNSIDRLSNGDYLFSLSGTFPSGGKIQIPQEIPHTTASGILSTSDTLMTVVSTKDWPRTGIMTKFNSNLATETCLTDGATTFPCSGAGNVQWLDFMNQSTQMTNQELIQYRVLSETQILLVNRGLNGTTKQAIAVDDSAIVVCGRAAVMFSSQVWETTATDGFSQIVVDNGADLSANVRVLTEGTSSEVDDKTGFADAHYMLTIAVNFEVLGTEGIRV